MRKQLLTTVAAVAIAGPAFAADVSGGYVPPAGDSASRSAPVSTVPAVVGDIELSLGYQDYEDWRSWDNFAFEGWARANVPVGNFNLLVETGGIARFGGDYPDGVGKSTLNAFGHVWGGTGGFRYGAFGGATFDWYGSTWGSVGGEVEADFGNATLGAQGFYSWADDWCGGCDPKIFGVNAWLDYYFTPNTKLTLAGQWAQDEDWHCCGDADFLGASARFTHRYAGSPLNVFVEGQYANFDFSGGPPNVDGYAVVGGITLNLDGGMSQEQHDKAVPFTYRGPLQPLGISF